MDGEQRTENRRCIFITGGASGIGRATAVLFAERGWFVGIPITAAGGGMLSSLVLVLLHHDQVAAAMPLQLYLPVLLFVLTILMVSRIRFPKAVLRDSKFINTFQIINIALIFYCGVTRSWPEYLFGIGVFLLIAGTIAGRISKPVATDTSE